jgi:hypothetical protein
MMIPITEIAGASGGDSRSKSGQGGGRYQKQTDADNRAFDPYYVFLHRADHAVVLHHQFTDPAISRSTCRSIERKPAAEMPATTIALRNDRRKRTHPIAAHRPTTHPKHRRSYLVK